MVKYGKKFRKKQFSEWREKYFNYKGYKKRIKSLVNEKNEDEFIIKKNYDKENEIANWTFQFEEDLDKDIKKIYIFFSNKERILYQKINKLLHMKEEYGDFELEDYLSQYKDLNELSVLSLNISEFIYYNLKAIIKILKKYDKKVIGQEFKNMKIKINFIQAKLEEQNSDILYLLKFKIIDEVNVIMENLITTLKEKFKSNKDKLNYNSENEVENKLIEGVQDINQAEIFIGKNHDKIRTNIKIIDRISAKVTALFLPWKNFLRISSDINSKLIQITKENSSSMSFNDSFNNIIKKSVVDTISFSKENKYNIMIILIHGLLYMFSFSVIIPSYTSVFSQFDKKKERYLWGILMVMAPLGNLFNYFYENKFFKKSTKTPIIISCIGLMIGNLLYAFAPKIDKFILIFIGRFVIGLSNLRTHNKMYLLNFLLKKDVSYYFTMFHTLSMLGLSLGFLINTGILSIDSDDEIFNKNTIGSFFAASFSLIFFFFTIYFFTEARSKYFNMTSLQMFGDGIFNENSNEIPNGELTKNDDENVETEVKRQSIILKDIDQKLANFNRLSKFDDTNLVLKSVNELAHKEEQKLNYLFNSFIVYLIIVFTTKFINESIYINSFIFLNQEENDDDYWVIALALGGSCFLSLLAELSLSCKNVFITEKNLLIILLMLLFINNGILIGLEYLEKEKDFYYSLIISNILANLTEKYTAHLFLYIIPENYFICCTHGNIIINIFAMISKILCSGLLIILDSLSFRNYSYTLFLIMTSLSFISFCLYLIFYQDIRVKAISRIMTQISKDEIKIATEL